MPSPNLSNGIKRRRQWEESEQSTILNFFSKARPLHNFHSKRKPRNRNESVSAKAIPQQTKKASSVTTSAITTANTTNTTSNRTDPLKKKKSTQLYLDFGQRNFGQQIVCGICNMLYVHGVQEDVQAHQAVCKEYRDGVSFLFKNCRIVQEFSNGDQIVEIRSTDSQTLRQKVRDCLLIVDQELGFASGTTSEERPKTTFLFVRQKRILGLALVEIVTQAFPLADKENGIHGPRSNNPVPAMLGIYKLWTHNKARKEGLATRLIDAARRRMVYGMIVPANRVAFSSPTQAGAQFAKHYVRKKKPKRDDGNDENKKVLVYDLHSITSQLQLQVLCYKK